jgi:regulator of sirC expression with transglutaminase-like and TPR domain
MTDERARGFDRERRIENGDAKRPAAKGLLDRAARERLLREIAGSGDTPVALAEAALALAAYDRPRVDLARYTDHLALLARDAATEVRGADGIAGRVAALNAVILGKHRYEGDTLTYDDLQNANLMRVIDRRKGLPVALGILYIHTARAQGWEMRGLAFPGHFLIRLDAAGERAIIDPFNGGAIRGAAELRDLLKAMSGNEAELAPEHYAPVADRQVLLRLQNNIKLRLVQSQRLEKALAVVENMLLFVPDQASLWREAALLNAHLGNYRAAIAMLEEYLRRVDEPSARHQAAALLQQFKSKLN